MGYCFVIKRINEENIKCVIGTKMDFVEVYFTNNEFYKFIEILNNFIKSDLDD